MRFVSLGTSEFSLATARGFADAGHTLLALVTLETSLLPENSADIGAAARALGVPSHEVKDINSSESIELLRSFAPDYLLVSWPKILKAEALTVPARCVIGSHPTKIPQNRGRHPLHWAIVLGLSETTLSFFRMDRGVDTGRILHTVPVEIRPEDEIQTLNDRVTAAGYQGAKELGAILLADPSRDGGVEQDHSGANYWRARTPHDGTLDFRMAREDLIRIVQSFTVPYPCAKILFGRHTLPVIKAHAVSGSLPPSLTARLEPGRIINVEGRTIAVKAADGLLECTLGVTVPEELQNAEHIYPPTYYVSQHGPEVFFPR